MTVSAGEPSDPAAAGGIGVGVVPKRRRGTEIRERLYCAALDEFDAHGVEGSRVERIVAEAAGQGRGEVRADIPPMVSATVLAAGVIFSTAPVLRAVASGEQPPSRVARVAGLAIEAARHGVSAG